MPRTSARPAARPIQSATRERFRPCAAVAGAAGTGAATRRGCPGQRRCHRCHVDLRRRRIRPGPVSSAQAAHQLGHAGRAGAGEVERRRDRSCAGLPGRSKPLGHDGRVAHAIGARRPYGCRPEIISRVTQARLNTSSRGSAVSPASTSGLAYARVAAAGLARRPATRRVTSRLRRNTEVEQTHSARTGHEDLSGLTSPWTRPGVRMRERVADGARDGSRLVTGRPAGAARRRRGRASRRTAAPW